MIEVKYALTFAGLDDACRRAMEQIRARRYDERLRNDGRENIMAYGIAFNRKRCRVICEKLRTLFGRIAPAADAVHHSVSFINKKVGGIAPPTFCYC